MIGQYLLIKTIFVWNEPFIRTDKQYLLIKTILVSNILLSLTVSWHISKKSVQPELIDFFWAWLTLLLFQSFWRSANLHAWNRKLNICPIIWKLGLIFCNELIFTAWYWLPCIYCRGDGWISEQGVKGTQQKVYSRTESRYGCYMIPSSWVRLTQNKLRLYIYIYASYWLPCTYCSSGSE